MDLSNLLDISTLQYLFLPRINEELKQFMAMWNNHKLSSEKNRTPLQLLFHYHANSTADPEQLPADPPDLYDEEDEGGGSFVAQDGTTAAAADAEEGGDDAVSLVEEAPLIVDSVSCEPIEYPLIGDDLVDFQMRIHPLSMNIAFHQLG